MDKEIDRLVNKVWKRYLELAPNQRLLIGISGIPGSGKTSISHHLSRTLNALASSHPSHSSPPSEIATTVPMDGYHLTRDQLSAMPDPAVAHARRGAEFTFDGAAFVALVRAVRRPVQPGAEDILAPSFDHAVKDPVPDTISVRPSHRVVVLEGIYLLMDRPPWREAGLLLDERWLVDVDLEVAVRRLAPRHLAAGICATPEEAERRARENDLPNGLEMLNQRLDPDEIIVSREDPVWTSMFR